MGLDRSQRPAGLVGDLLEAQFSKEPQRDDLPIGLVETPDGGADPDRTFGTERRDRGVRTTRQVDSGRRIGRIDPGDIPPALGAAERDSDGDPGHPRPERAFATPGGQASKGGHEGLLRGVLGLVEVAEHAMARSQDGGTLALDEEPERVPVAAQDSIDSGALIGDLGRDGWGGAW